MSPMELSETEDALLEECIDELDAVIDELQRFPKKVLLQALGTHVVCLARALAEHEGLWSRELLEFGEALVSDLTHRDAGP